MKQKEPEILQSFMELQNEDLIKAEPKDSMLFKYYTALGYEYTPEKAKKMTVGEIAIPVAREVSKANGAPLLWIIPVNDTDREQGLLASKPYADCEKNYEDLLSDIFFVYCCGNPQICGFPLEYSLHPGRCSVTGPAASAVQSTLDGETAHDLIVNKQQ